MKTATFILAMLLAPSAWAGSYYACTGPDGKKSFQDKPCPDSHTEQTKEFQELPPTSAGTYDPQALADKLGADNQRRQLDRDITRSERKIRDYSEQMNSEMASLRQKKTYANNNEAGAQWETSISGEMSAVAAKYQALMDAEKDRLAQLREQRAGLSEQ